MADRGCGLIVVLGVLLASFHAQGSPKLANDPDTAVCEHWSDVARQMTGSGRLQTCVNNKTDSCTRLDCNGTVVYPYPIFLEIDYCFGCVLNSCNEPVSMDFYLQVPSKNQTFTRRIHHDTDVEIKEMSFDIPLYGSVYPVLSFEFEHQQNGDIKFSVKVMVKAGISYVPDVDLVIIDEETIHGKTCMNISNDTSDKPGAGLVLGQCFPEKYTFPSAGPSPGKPGYKPSATLNKSCDMKTKHCGLGEVCDLSKKQPVCRCQGEFKLSQKGDVCISESRYGQKCRQQHECGYHEECVKNLAICRCEEGYTYSTSHRMCIFHQPGTPTEAPPKGADTPGPPPAQVTTQEPQGTVNGTSGSGGGGKSPVMAKLPPILGGVLGGVTVLAAATWGFVYFRRRRLLRNRLDTALSMRDESTEALLGDTDDMVM